MQTYIGTKAVHALPMTRAKYNEYRGWELPADENGEDDGFLVEYMDGGKPNHSAHEGYISWSPADVFFRAYVPTTGKMAFSKALNCLKAGLKVARDGWNGKGMFLYHVHANTYAAQTAAAKDHFGDTVPYRAYIAMKTVDNDVVPWVASQTDILENDWMIVD